MKEFMSVYKQLNEEQRTKLFTEEQKEILDKVEFFDKMFNDPQFYKAVEQSVAEEVYKELRK